MGVCVACVCGGGGVGIGNVEEVVKTTGVTGQHTPKGTGTANTEAKLALPHAATATADHTLVRLVSCKYTHSLTHSLTDPCGCPVCVSSACTAQSPVLSRVKQNKEHTAATATATKMIGECVLATEGLEPPVACHPAGHATDRQARLVTAYHKALGGEAVGVCVACVWGGGGGDG